MHACIDRVVVVVQLQYQVAGPAGVLAWVGNTIPGLNLKGK